MVKEIYIAAPFTEREEAKLIRARLEKNGILSTARWIDSHLDDAKVKGDATLALQECREDLLDISRADSFLLLNYPEWQHLPRVGMSVELGWALAKGKRIFMIGGPTHIFHYHTSIQHIKRVEEIQ